MYPDGTEGVIQLPIYFTPCKVNEKGIKGRGLLSLYLTREATFPEGMSGQRSRRNTQTIPDFFGRSVCGARAFGGFLIASSWFLFFGFCLFVFKHVED